MISITTRHTGHIEIADTTNGASVSYSPQGAEAIADGLEDLNVYLSQLLPRFTIDDTDRPALAAAIRTHLDSV